MNLHPAQIAVLSTFCFVAGCQTTGDPRQGGLFGWSEQKAIERNHLLQRDRTDAVGQADAEAARAAQLKGRESGLQSEAARLKADNDRLLSDNLALDRQLRELMTRRRVSGSELVRLQQVLAINHRVAQTARTAAPTGPAQANPLDDQNRALQREVMILLQR